MTKNEKSDFQKNGCIEKQVDFCSVQEHFKMSKKIDKFLWINVKHFGSYVILVIERTRQGSGKWGTSSAYKERCWFKER